MDDDKKELYLQWAKQNKKKIARAYLSSQHFESSDSPSIIFMAGLPGAGKTEFAKRLLPQLEKPMLHIDLDNLAENISEYQPKFANLFRPGANIILEKLFDEAVKRKIDILMDGTLGHHKALENTRRVINKHGYKVRVYFISIDPITAWRNTLYREKVEHRNIENNGFINTYYQLLHNLNQIQDVFGGDIPISVVIKEDSSYMKNIVQNVDDISRFTKPVLTKDELSNRIESERIS